jgi:hypothetical protein
MALPALSTRDDFDIWMFKMDDALDEFFAQLPPNVRERLDFSTASQDVLEKWLLDRYPSPRALLSTADKHLLDGAARSVGETSRKTAGGHGTIDLDNPKTPSSACRC